MYCINVLYKCTVLVYYIQGGQNFFEKIRTFLEEIRTIRTIFEKNPYNPYIFFEREQENKRTREQEN